MFKRRESGYTIVETMIFLAVSGVILIAALLLFQNQQGKTQFEQSMRDINSKIEQYVNDVNSGSFDNPNSYSCTATNGGPPQLSTSQAGLGSNQTCVFLGKAIGVTPGSGVLKIYTVLGDRTDASGTPVTTFASANPTVADQSGVDLTTQYNLLWGASVISSAATYTDSSGNTQTSPSGQNWNLFGFYNSGAQGNNGGSQNVLGLAYDLTSAPSNSAVSNWVQGTSGHSYSLQSWNLCIQSGSTSRHGLLIVNASGLGVTSKVQIGGC